MKRKNGWKRLVSAVVSAVMLCGTGGILQIPNLFYSDNRLDAYAADTNTVLSIAREYEGNQSYTNWCLKYVQDVFDRAGIYATRLVNATAAKNAWMTHTDRNIPAGAVVFFDQGNFAAVVGFCKVRIAFCNVAQRCAGTYDKRDDKHCSEPCIALCFKKFLYKEDAEHDRCAEHGGQAPVACAQLAEYPADKYKRTAYPMRDKHHFCLRFFHLFVCENAVYGNENDKCV